MSSNKCINCETTIEEGKILCDRCALELEYNSTARPAVNHFDRGLAVIEVLLIILTVVTRSKLIGVITLISEYVFLIYGAFRLRYKYKHKT